MAHAMGNSNAVMAEKLKTLKLILGKLGHYKAIQRKDALIQLKDFLSVPNTDKRSVQGGDEVESLLKPQQPSTVKMPTAKDSGIIDAWMLDIHGLFNGLFKLMLDEDATIRRYFIDNFCKYSRSASIDSRLSIYRKVRKQQAAIANDSHRRGPTTSLGLFELYVSEEWLSNGSLGIIKLFLAYLKMALMHLAVDLRLDALMVLSELLLLYPAVFVKHARPVFLLLLEFCGYEKISQPQGVIDLTCSSPVSVPLGKKQVGTLLRCLRALFNVMLEHSISQFSENFLDEAQGGWNWAIGVPSNLFISSFSTSRDAAVDIDIDEISPFPKILPEAMLMGEPRNLLKLEKLLFKVPVTEFADSDIHVILSLLASIFFPT